MPQAPVSTTFLPANSSPQPMPLIATLLASSSLPRIEPVARMIADQIDRQHEQEQAQPGKRRDPPCRRHVVASDAEDRAPARHHRPDAGAAEGKPRPQA